MKTLKFLLFFSILTTTTLIQAQTSNNNAPIFSNFMEMAEGDEVSLSAFMINQEKVLIQWKSKISGVYFEIEKSKDGENFEMIATSEDVVKSADGSTFQFVDESPVIENYYRIFYITPSGTVDYSDVTFISPLPSDMTLDGLK